jgi:uncharacterized protein
MIPDVNVVLAAARPDHAHHALARVWWLDAMQTANAARTIRLLPVVVSGFLRISTHPKIFKVPSTIQAATAHVDALLSLPNVDLFEVQPNWHDFERLCNDKSLTGNTIPDAWIAATVAQHGEHLVTFDKDFRKLLTRSQVTVLKA